MKKYKNAILIFIVVALAIIPFVINKDADFAGADAEAQKVIGQIDSTYKPWFSSLFKPSSGEIESLLFALQAAIGAGILGYGFGFFKGSKKKKEENVDML